MPRSRVRPAPEAVSLGRLMERAQEVHEEVLEETLAAAERGQVTESGRTICPEGTNAIKPPLDRFPKAVDLQGCPRGSAGIVHTHTSIAQLRTPEHSLPDVANVVLEGVDASLVAGTRSHDLLVAPDDSDRARALLNDALGLDVESTSDVVAALRDGRIREPPAARRRVRSRLRALFSTPRSGLSGFDERVAALSRDDKLAAHGRVTAACPAHPAAGHGGREPATFGECCRRFKRRLRDNEAVLHRLLLDVKQADPIGVGLQTYLRDRSRRAVL